MSFPGFRTLENIIWLRLLVAKIMQVFLDLILRFTLEKKLLVSQMRYYRLILLF